MPDKLPNKIIGYPPEFPQLCRYLTERSPQPLLAVQGPSHIVRYANQAFRSLLGPGATRLIGRPFAEAVPEGVANQCETMLNKVLSSGLPQMLTAQEHGLESHATVPHSDRLPEYWSYLAWAILGATDDEDEAPIGVMIQVTDETEASGFSNKLAAINEALLLAGIGEHELRGEAEKVTAELRAREGEAHMARHEAQEANRSKDAFLATLSHELRTPLSAILGWAVMLRTGDKELDPDVAEGLAVIERNARAQGKLIEEVLDVARVMSGKFVLDMQPVDLAELLRTALDTVRPSANAKAITLELFMKNSPEGQSESALWIRGDALRLQQAVLNLLTNALKFTPKGGRITAALQRRVSEWGEMINAEPGTGIVRITVTDTGKGIDHKFLPYIFDLFEQAGTETTRTYGGLGLGLSIVKHVVNTHGGTVRAQSEGPGRGSTFTMELPSLAESEVPTALSDDHATCPSLAGLRILIVDDQRDVRTMARRALESAGATVVLAESAEEAFRLAIEGPVEGAIGGAGKGSEAANGSVKAQFRAPDVIVSDIGMPGEDGYSLMRRIRASAAGEMPALALTAFASPEDKARALAAGFQVHLAKPVDPRRLIAVISKLARR